MPKKNEIKNEEAIAANTEEVMSEVSFETTDYVPEETETAPKKSASRKHKKKEVADVPQELVASVQSDAETTVYEPKGSRQQHLKEARQRLYEHQQQREHLTDLRGNWTNIEVAKQQSSILKGMVVSVEDIGGKMAAAVVYLYGNIKTLIPFSEFYAKDPIDKSTVSSQQNLLLRQSQMLANTIGLDVYFTITQTVFDENDLEASLVVASRKSASERLKKRCFGGGKDAYKEGEFYDGFITAVGSNALRIMVGGHETSLPKFRATNRYVDSMSDMFAVNDRIRVKLVKVEGVVGDNMENLSIVVDARPAELELMKVNLAKVKEGSIQVGRITGSHFFNQKMRYKLHLGLIDVVATCIGTPSKYAVRSPQTGDRLSVQITKVDHEKGIAFARVIGQVSK